MLAAKKYNAPKRTPSSAGKEIRKKLTLSPLKESRLLVKRKAKQDNDYMPEFNKMAYKEWMSHKTWKRNLGSFKRKFNPRELQLIDKHVDVMTKKADEGKGQGSQAVDGQLVRP